MDPVRALQLQEQIRNQFLGQVYGSALESIQHRCFRYCLTEPTDTLTENQKGCMNRCTDRYREAHREVSEAFAMRMDSQYAQH